MAEPLSFIASILTLIEASGKLVSVSYTFLSKLSHAEETYAALVTKFTAIAVIVVQFHSIVTRDPRPSLALGELYKNGTLRRCKELLVDIKETILEEYDEDTISTISGRLRWIARGERRTKQWITELEALENTMSNALSADTAIMICRVQQTCEELHDFALADRQQKLLNWIAPLNVAYKDNYETALSKRFGTTGSWLFGHPDYQAWKQDGSVFFLMGVPGTGKTILSATVIQELQKMHPTGVIYYYFRFQDAFKIKLGGFYDSLIRQLLLQNKDGYLDVAELHQKLGGGNPSEDQLCHLLSNIIQRFNVVHLVIDAVEDTTELGGLLSALRALGASCQSANRLRIFMTCRSTAVSNQLTGTTLTLSPDVVQADIEQYTGGRIAEMATGRRMQKEDRKYITNAIVTNSNGLFLQAEFQLDTISRELTVRDVERAVANLSNNLNGTYRTMLEHIFVQYPKKSDKERLRRLFILLCQGNYCLSMDELAALISVEDDHTHVEVKSIPADSEQLGAMLGWLRNVDSRVSPPEINFAHITIEMFLQPNGDVDQNDPLRDIFVFRDKAQRELARLCIKYCNFPEFAVPLEDWEIKNPFKALSAWKPEPLDEKKSLQEESQDEKKSLDEKNKKLVELMNERFEDFKGYNYAIYNWPEHINRADFSWKEFKDDVLPKLEWFTSPTTPGKQSRTTHDEQSSNPSGKQYQSWQEAHAFMCTEISCHCNYWQPPLYFAIRYCLVHLVKHLISKEDCNLYKLFEGGVTPVQLAQMTRCQEIIDLFPKDKATAGATEEIVEMSQEKLFIRRRSSCRDRSMCYGCAGPLSTPHTSYCGIWLCSTCKSSQYSNGVNFRYSLPSLYPN